MGALKNSSSTSAESTAGTQTEHAGTRADGWTNPYSRVLDPLDSTVTPDLNEVTGGGVKGLQGTGRTIDNYSDIQRYLEDEIRQSKTPSIDQMQKAARRHRSRQIVNSAADAGRALANLFATVNYAPNGYVEGQGLTERAQARYDRLLQTDNAARQQYYNNLMALARIKDGRQDRKLAQDKAVADQQNARMMMQLRLWENARAEAKDRRDAALHEIQLQVEQGKLDGVRADAARKSIQAAYEGMQQEADLILKGARTSQANAAAAASGPHYRWFDENGKPHYEYDKDEAIRNAQAAGTWHPVTGTDRSVKTEPKLGGGNKTTTTTNTKVVGGYSMPPAPKSSGTIPGLKDDDDSNTIPGL